MQESLRSLKSVVEDLATEAALIRAEIHRRTTTLWVAVAACVVVIVCIGLAAWTVAADNRRAIADNNRRWCPMVAILLPGPDVPPPTTERGRAVVANAQRLYNDFGCARRR